MFLIYKEFLKIEKKQNLTPLWNKLASKQFREEKKMYKWFLIIGKDD